MKNSYKEKEKRILKKLGEKVRKYRVLNDLSQEELAFRADLDRTYISGIERGERNISVITLSKISDALNIDMTNLLSS